MNSDKPDGSTKPIPPVSLFRGLYDRVAKRLGVDPSYVSRVARGERKSAVVAQVLAEEVQAIRDHLNSQDSYFPGMDETSHAGASRDGSKQAGAARRDDGEREQDNDGGAKRDGLTRKLGDEASAGSRSKKSKGKSESA